MAVLFGNNNYDVKGMSLVSAANDANDLSTKLKELDFDVDVHIDYSRTDMGKALADFERQLPEYQVGLFFFAGHGFQIDGNNYLANVDTSFEDDSSIKHTALPLDDAIHTLESSSLSIKIIIIDACRRAVSGNMRGMNSGFAPIFAPKGTIIAFATSPGQTAKETDNHGYFTSAILQHISTKNISIEEMFKRVRNSVYMMSRGNQVTWEHTSLMGDFKFGDIPIKVSEEIYSRYAYADKDYECVPNSKAYTWITAAKSYNYNSQNPIIEQIKRYKNELINEDISDLFVLGRNLYQASNNAFSISNYFENLHTNLLQLNLKVATHILNGMAYEIYFDSNGRIRKFFKTFSFKPVLAELMSNEFETCRDFISNKLKGYPQKVFYIPGEATLNLEVYLQAYTEEDLDHNMLCPSKIIMDGINIMYNRCGNELFSDGVYFSLIEGNINDFVELIREKTVATKRGLNVTYIADDEFNPQTDGILYPKVFQLLKYSN